MLVQDPQGHFRVGYQPHRKLQRYDPVDRNPVEAADIHQFGGENSIGQGLLRVPLEGQGQYLRPVPRRLQLRLQVLGQHLRAAIAERDLGIQYQYIHALSGRGRCIRG